MLELIELESDKVIGARMSGKITTEQFDRVVAVLEERLERHDKVRVYAEIDSFGGMSTEAFLKDIKLGLKHWKRFDREAVVTDTQWLRSVSEAAGKLFPGIEVKGFATSEAEAARRWIQAD